MLAVVLLGELLCCVCWVVGLDFVFTRRVFLVSLSALPCLALPCLALPCLAFLSCLVVLSCLVAFYTSLLIFTGIFVNVTSGPYFFGQDYFNLQQLMEEASSSRDAARTSAVVSALVQHIMVSWREHFARAVAMKFNCFFLMPFVDDFPFYLRQVGFGTVRERAGRGGGVPISCEAVVLGI